MMAAITAAERGCRVVLLEKNQAPGRKLLITGNGRCNLTNSADNDAVLKKVLRNPRFLIRAFRDFSSRDTMRFFRMRGSCLQKRTTDGFSPRAVGRRMCSRC
ncbi:MAG: NAD(P)/FAD-dependent oxidoreductase [Eubacterium sp.]|nr:NAD(P)/FAD-dependent oxidoreductase [Eubacterium sp.]